MEGFDLSTISNVYVGSTQYSEIYYGSDKVWPTGAPGPQSYVLDGLIFHLDGIDKGLGSDWVDLINNVLFVANNCTSTTNSYLLAGSSDSYLIGPRDTLIGSDYLTVEVCYYNTSTNNEYYIFGCGGNQSSKNPLFYKDSNNITWYLGGFVYDGSSIQNNSKFTISLNNDHGFVNGNSIPIKSSVDYWDFNNPSIRIGHASSGGAVRHPFCGHIYSIRIYNRRLTQAEQLLNQSVDNLRFSLGLPI